MRKAELLRVVREALAERDLASLVAETLPSRTPAARVIAIGKAAPAMAAGALARWGTSVEHCLVVAPDATSVAVVTRAAAHARVSERLVIMRAGHPLPDNRSLRAGRACLELVKTQERRRILVLVSGGASALVCAPSEGIHLATKRAIGRALLRSGAPVQELNVVRKHLSRIKGGGLARAAVPNDVLTLVVSDVIGGSASDVGSGPSLPDDSTIADARRILRERASAYARVALVETLAPDSPIAQTLHAEIIASPETLTHDVARLLRAHGHRVRELPSSQAPAADLAAEYVALARKQRSARIFVRAAEPSIAVPARAGRGGRGGRSSHVAALVGRGLAALGSESARVVFAAFATDGVDGLSGTAGAIVTEAFAARVSEQLGSAALDRAIDRFDTGSLHLAMGTALRERPSGHNYADLHILAVSRA